MIFNDRDIIKSNTKVKVLNDSWEFLKMNLNDILTIPYSSVDIKYYMKKMIKTKKEFNKYYKDNTYFERQLFALVEKYDDNNTKKVLDVIEYDKSLRFKIRIDQDPECQKLFKKYDQYSIYLILYRYFIGQYVPDSYTKYCYCKISSDNRHIFFITFDENEIGSIYTLVTENVHDVMSDVSLENITDNSILDPLTIHK